MKLGNFDLSVLAKKAFIGAASAVAGVIATGFIPTSAKDLKVLAGYAAAGAAAGLGIDLKQFKDWKKANVSL